MGLIFIVLICIAPSAFADLDKDQQQGLQQTKDLLTNPDARQKAINKDPKAKDMDDKVTILGGSKENKEGMYDLAAQLMDKIAKETNGDPEKMQKMMEEAQKNPEAFYNKYFDAKQKAQVRGIATKIERDKPSVSSHP